MLSPRQHPRTMLRLMLQPGRKTTSRLMCLLRRSGHVPPISSRLMTSTFLRRHSAVRSPTQPTGHTAGRPHCTKAAMASLGMRSMMLGRRGFRPVPTTGEPSENPATVCARRWRRLRCRMCVNEIGTNKQSWTRPPPRPTHGNARPGDTHRIRDRGGVGEAGDLHHGTRQRVP